jgi:prepilin-type N-terminal cleavage/methylation domain-containing protein
MKVCARGFTLIEVIVSLVVAAILGTIIFTFMSSRLAGSALLLHDVRNTYNLSSVMENILADYKQKIADQNETNPLATMKNSIGTAGSTYTNIYGSYKVVENGYITFTCSGKTCQASAPGNAATNNLKVKIADAADSQTITSLLSQ